MRNLRPLGRLGVVAVLTVVASVALSAVPSSAQPAENADVEQLQLQLSEVDAAQWLALEQIEYFERLLEEGRIYLVPLVIGGEEYWQVVPEEEAVLLWVYRYLTLLMDSGASFSSDGLSTYLDERLAESLTLAELIADDIARLEDYRAQLSRDRSEIEQLLAQMLEAATLPPETAPPDGQVSDPDPPQDGLRCVTLAGIAREGHLGMTADTDAKVHRVTSGGDTGRGWEGAFELTWTAPPNELCEGKRYETTLTARNLGPVDDVSLHNAAQVGMTFMHPFLTAECSNPIPFDPKSSALVAPDEAEYVNTCTVTVNHVGEAGNEDEYIFVRLGAIPEIGVLAYIYK